MKNEIAKINRVTTINNSIQLYDGTNHLRKCENCGGVHFEQWQDVVISGYKFHDYKCLRCGEHTYDQTQTKVCEYNYMDRINQIREKRKRMGRKIINEEKIKLNRVIL